MSNPNLTAALSYLKRGWSVIPISPRNKTALVKWKHLEERLPTTVEVTAWWKEFPKAYVGIITGEISNLVVVDIDPRHGGNVDEWAERQPTGVRVTTPSGGAHFYYYHPADGAVRNSAGRIAAGVDVRGHGGYVVAPPSDGYQWAQDWSDGSHATEYHAAAERQPTTGTPSKDDGWLTRVLQGVGHGQRNDAAARLAGYYLKKKLPPDVVLQTLVTWNQLNDPPLEESDLRVIVDSVGRTASSRASLLVRTIGPETNGDEGAYPVVGFGSYMAKHGAAETSWIIKDWLPKQTVGLVVSPPATFKTWLLQDLAVSVASGLPFLGQYPVLEPGPVLFMQQEDFHGQIAGRFGLIASRRADVRIPRMEGNRIIFSVPPRLPIYLHEHRSFRFDDGDVVDAWIQQIKKLKPSLVILDPLYSAGSVQDFMAGTAREMFLFKSIRDALGTTFLIAHHTRKSSRDASNGGPKPAGGPVANPSPEREDTWGSQFLNAWLETGWQLRRRDELGSATIMRHFKAAADAKQSTITFHIDTTKIPGGYDVTVSDNKVGVKDEGADVTGLLMKSGALTVSQLAEKSGQHRSTIHRRVENLLKHGVLGKRGNTIFLKEGALE